MCGHGSDLIVVWVHIGMTAILSLCGMHMGLTTIVSLCRCETAIASLYWFFRKSDRIAVLACAYCGSDRIDLGVYSHTTRLAFIGVAGLVGLVLVCTTVANLLSKTLLAVWLFLMIFIALCRCVQWQRSYRCVDVCTNSDRIAVQVLCVRVCMRSDRIAV